MHQDKMDQDKKEIIASTAQTLFVLQTNDPLNISTLQEFFNACMNKEYEINSEEVRKKLNDLELFDEEKRTIRNRDLLSTNLDELHAKLKACRQGKSKACSLY